MGRYNGKAVLIEKPELEQLRADLARVTAERDEACREMDRLDGEASKWMRAHDEAIARAEKAERATRTQVDETLIVMRERDRAEAERDAAEALLRDAYEHAFRGNWIDWQRVEALLRARGRLK